MKSLKSILGLSLALASGALIGCVPSGDGTMGSSSDAALRTQGTAPDSGSGGVGKVTICHLPPGNPANAHTLSVGAPAVRAHLAHGDYLGACADKPPVDDPPVDNPPVDNPPSDDPPVGDPSGSQSAS